MKKSLRFNQKKRQYLALCKSNQLNPKRLNDLFVQPFCLQKILKQSICTTAAEFETHIAVPIIEIIIFVDFMDFFKKEKFENPDQKKVLTNQKIMI